MSIIATRDITVAELEAQVVSVRTAALSNMRLISEQQQTNEYLVGVYEDYDRYTRTLLGAKREQMRGLRRLAAYLKQAEAAADATALTLRRIKGQEGELKRRISEVREESDQLVRALAGN
jgi:hypothetical protein